VQYQGDKVMVGGVNDDPDDHVTLSLTRQNLKSKAPVIVWSDGEDSGDGDGDEVGSGRSGGSGSESSRNR
jgi:hypothetical protein